MAADVAVFERSGAGNEVGGAGRRKGSARASPAKGESGSDLDMLTDLCCSSRLQFAPLKSSRSRKVAQKKAGKRDETRSTTSSWNPTAKRPCNAKCLG